MDRMKFMPFRKDKPDKRGFFGDRTSKDSEDGSLMSMFKRDEGGKKKETEDEAVKVANLRKRLEDINIMPPEMDDSYITYALHSLYAGRDEDRAFEMLLYMKDAFDGVLKPYDPNVHMLGAVNRGSVTCWLDATLFAMFTNLTSFEPMLHASFEDPKKSRLVNLIRLWVNMLRTGKLIEVDLTSEIQSTLAKCGWEQAAEYCQNDASEAFAFITETLGLPLLTMEMDIFHEGGTDEADHKIINERLLEVAIPPSNDGLPVRLEDCLEEHFNTRVEVMRRMAVRRDTMTSRHALSPTTSNVDEEKLLAADDNISVVDNVQYATDSISGSPPPIVESPALISESPVMMSRPSISRTLASMRAPSGDISNKTRPAMNRDRATSIIRRIVVPNDEEEAGPSPMRASPRPPSMAESTRKGSVRKEVLMPAWQFFRILPWYTTDVPDNDAQVAAHFSKSNPVIGICLKRYGWSAQGVAFRSNTVVDIPLQIALPHFIQDDLTPEDGAPAFGNFKMVLQSMVCHRGESVNSGHYISIIRSKKSDRHSAQQTASGGPPEYAEDQWVKLDDLNNPRTEVVSIDDAMKKETPYLLFYQVQPMFEEDQFDATPPPYETSGVVSPSAQPMPYEEEDSMATRRSSIVATQHLSEPVASIEPSLEPTISASNSHSQGYMNEVTVAIQEASPIAESSAAGYFPSTNTSESWTKSRTSMSSDTDQTELTTEPTASTLNIYSAERLTQSFSEANMDATIDRPLTASEDVKALELDKSSTQPELGTRLSRAASRLGLGPRDRSSRPPSQHDDSRKSGTFSRLVLMKMKDKEKEREKEAAAKDSAKKSAESSGVDVSAVDSVATSSTDLAMSSNATEIADEKPDDAGVEIKQKDKKKEKKEKELEKEKEHHHRHSLHRAHKKTNSTSTTATDKEKPERECSVM